MNCDRVRSELIAYLKGELAEEHVGKLEEHLVRCPSCRNELEGARKLLSWTEAASDQAVVNKVEQIIDDAARAGASDVHFEPRRDGSLLVRYRIDGVLKEVTSVDPVRRYGIVTRVKMLADTNVSETSVPQTGRFTWNVDDKSYDLRMSTMPFVFGEGVVVRLLEKSCALIGLDQLGLSDDHLKTVDGLLGRPNGLIVVAGPTGSGRTTTVYSMLQHVNNPSIKLVTVENPVEYLVHGACQCQLNEKTGFTYPSAIRAMMRLDPDVIYIGESRDLETLTLAAEAALTGHLVITVVHRNDSASVLQYLSDVGLEPYVIGATLIGVIAQRLARRVCELCKEEARADPNDPKLKALGITPGDLKQHKLYRGRGCEECRSTGYRGRIGIYEVLTLDRELAATIADGATGNEVVEAARAKGFLPMKEDGKRKVLEGITTVDEVFRILA